MKIDDQVNYLYLLATATVTIQLWVHVYHFPPIATINVMTEVEQISLFFTFLYSDLLSAIEVTCVLLIFPYLHDYKILKRRKQTGDSASLDQAGIQYINQNFQLDTVIIHEDDHCGPPKIYKHSLSQYTDSSFYDVRLQFDHYQRQFDENIEGIPRRGETYLNVNTLPYLPVLSHRSAREQVGLFARQDIPQWSLFYWIGDTHIIHDSERHLLSSTVRMNRRTLATFDDVSFFQGGDPQQRSGCGVLANFFWCHTESTPKALCPYWILPSHFLGEANCVYVTTKKEGHLCSALLAFKALKANEQLLMFTGHDQEDKTIERRIRLYHLLPLIAGCGIGITIIKHALIRL